MPILSNRALLAAHVIQVDYVRLDVTPHPVCVWKGDGILQFEGQTLWGVGYLGAITPVQAAVSGKAPAMAVTLGAADRRLVTYAMADEPVIRGREITVRRALFERRNGVQEFIGERVRFTGIMDRVIYRQQWVEIEETKSRLQMHTVTVTFEDMLGSRRNMPSGRTYSHADQIATSAGDKGLIFGGTLQFHRERWPIFP